jgi:protein O-mannosyl-transferase
MFPVCVAVFAFALYSPTLSYHSVNYDDPWLLDANTKLQQLSVSEIPSLFSDFSPATRYMLGAEYLPIRDLAIAFDFAVWGSWYPGFHLTAVLLYALTALLLAFMLRGFGLPTRIAWLATLLWVAHPSHVESVAWLTERKGVLSAFFVAATGCVYARYRIRDSSSKLVAAIAVLAVCAVWSKALALFGLAGIGLLDIFLLAPSPRRIRALAVLLSAGLLAFVPVFVVAQRGSVIVADDIANSTAGGVNRFAGAIGLVGHYARSLTATRTPSIVYSIEYAGPAWHDYVVGGLACIAALGFAVWCARRQRWRRPHVAIVAAALAWFAAGFFPVSRLLFPIKIVAADRYMLLPSLSIALLVATALSLIRSYRLFIAASCVVIAATVSLTLTIQPIWSSSVALFEHTAHQQPDYPELWLRWSANVYGDDNDPIKAEAIVDRGLQLHPNDASLILKKSDYRAAAHDLAGAEQWLRVGASHTYARCYDHLALMMLSDGRLAEAVSWADKAVAKRPQEPSFRQTLAQTLEAAGRDGDALTARRDVVRLAPTVGSANFELGKALWRANKRDEAAQYLDFAATMPEFSAAVKELRTAP